MKHLLSAFLLLSLVVGCGADPAVSQHVPDTEYESWVLKKPNSYAYTLDLVAGITPPSQVRIFVENDRVVRVVNLATGDTLDPQYVQNYPQYFPSIDGLYTIIQTAQDNGSELQVTYDPTRHIPVYVDIDRNLRPVDGGRIYTVTDYVPQLRQ
jgi:hypothetical protein